MLGDCDESVEEVCEGAGWSQELDGVEVTSLEESLGS